jgi:hypothetical protein
MNSQRPNSNVSQIPVLKGSAVVNAQQIEKGRGALQINKRDQTLLTSKQTFIEKEKTGGKIPGIDAHYVDDDEYEAVSMSKEEANYNYKKTAEDLMKERNY